MELTHIDLGKLTLSAINMRHGKRPPDVSDILPSVRARGVLVPLLVRSNGAQMSTSRSSPADAATSPPRQ